MWIKRLMRQHFISQSFIHITGCVPSAAGCRLRHLQQGGDTGRRQLGVYPPQQPHQVAVHVLHVDAGKEEFIKY